MVRKTALFITVIGLLGSAPLLAQSASDAMQDAAAQYAAWIGVMSDITRDIEVGERDIRHFLDHWQDLEALDLSDMDEEDPAAFEENFQDALGNARYRNWAAGKGLDPERFLRGSLRITSLFMLDQAAIQAAVAPQQLANHAAMVEEQCKQVDQRTCDDMRAMLEASRNMQQVMTEARQQLRPPSAGERALFDRYGADLQAVMLSDDDEESYEDDEYSYDEDDDYSYDE